MHKQPIVKLRDLKRKIDDRVIVGQFPDDQETDGDDGDHGQDDNFLRGEPVQLFTAIEHNLQAADANHQ